MIHLERVRREVARYEHLVLAFDVRESPVAGAGVYLAPVHPRDIDHPQFEWGFQRYLYDCIHDYMAELFTRNPQKQEQAR